LGSGNGIARSLNIPQKFKEAISLLLSPKIINMDIGILNGEIFIGIAGTGYDALIGKKFQTFGARGPLPYFLISLKEYLRYRYQKYALHIDNELLEVKALMVTFANTREYGNGAVIAPDANPIDGIINVCIITPQKMWGAIRAAYMLFNNTINQHSGYITKKCRTVTVEAEGDQMYTHRDGEPADIADIIEVGILTKALRVCSPRSENQ
jgi:diacylglycerol kinase family enzyme